MFQTIKQIHVYTYMISTKCYTNSNNINLGLWPSDSNSSAHQVTTASAEEPLQPVSVATEVVNSGYHKPTTWGWFMKPIHYLHIVILGMVCCWIYHRGFERFN